MTQIIEGTTKILVPKESLVAKVPPKTPAFFNPRARYSRDISIIAYAAFVENFDGPKIFLDGLSGLGARGLRVANEIPSIQVTINDLNPSALELAIQSASLNKLENFKTQEKETCRFFSDFSQKGNRASIVDIDPFGSCARYLDCGIRATMHGGLLSITSTDQQVLHGRFGNACKRRYGGMPIRTEYGDEIAIRLMLGCLRSISARLDITISPVYVESNMHYYRVYTIIQNRPDQKENLGFIFHCKACGNRGASNEIKSTCPDCNQNLENAGPLWIGKLFDKEFIKNMLQCIDKFQIIKTCQKTLQKNILESELPATYYTLDEIASMMKNSPIMLETMIQKLQERGFLSSPTCFKPTGFRTNAKIKDIKDIIKDVIKDHNQDRHNTTHC